jgi:hypothetical protein
MRRERAQRVRWGRPLTVHLARPPWVPSAAATPAEEGAVGRSRGRRAVQGGGGVKG